MRSLLIILFCIFFNYADAYTLSTNKALQWVPDTLQTLTFSQVKYANIYEAYWPDNTFSHYALLDLSSNCRCSKPSKIQTFILTEKFDNDETTLCFGNTITENGSRNYALCVLKTMKLNSCSNIDAQTCADDQTIMSIEKNHIKKSIQN